VTDWNQFKVAGVTLPLPLLAGPTWASGAAVSINAYTSPTVPNDFVFQVTSAGTGTIGAAEPTWPTTVGSSTTADSHGVIWKCVGTLSANSLLRDADPSVFYLIDFLQYVINTYIGPRLMQEVVAADSTIATKIPSAIAQAYSYEPMPEFLENQVQLPGLFVYRTRAQTEQWTVSHDHDIVSVQIDYVLPPLDSAGCERLLPILSAIAQALRKKVTDAWDPGYTPPGGTLGQTFTDPSLANLQEVGFGSAIEKKVAGTSSEFYRIGRLPGMGNLWFPTLTLSAYFIERDEYAPTIGGPSKLAGVDLTGNVKGDDGTVVPAASVALVQASTHGPPTITSLSVATGSAAGGTSVVITGTLFLSGPPRVFFGPPGAPQYAASVTYTSSTSLTITTPAMQGAGTVDLTILNRDGQSVTSPAAFTFT
jgi:hypothetical protein